jgi:hypothetical protein
MSEEVKSASEVKKEDWMNSKWRPMMGWMYMLVCTMDMVVFPILWSLLQTLTHSPMTQWNPLTLQGAGLFHIAMGAVLGIAAFGRTQEKLGGANNGGIQTPTTGFASGSPAFGAPSTGFGAAPGGFGAPASTTAPSSFGGGGFGSAPTTRTPGSFNAAPLGAAAVGAAGGFAVATAMPAMDKPMPSRPPLDEDFPEID